MSAETVPKFFGPHYFVLVFFRRSRRVCGLCEKVQCSLDGPGRWWVYREERGAVLGL